MQYTVGSKQTEEKRNRLLAALFSQAKKKGIQGDELRDVIAPGLIGKRLSEATMQEIVRVIEHLSGENSNGQRAMGNEKKYASSRAGLIEELADAAKERWGEDFEKPLNAFINSHRRLKAFTITHYRFLNVTWLKGIKERLREMNRKWSGYEK